MVNLGKFGSFLADSLVDQPYGLTYEINNKRVNVIPPLPIEELGKNTLLMPWGHLMMLQRIRMQQTSLSTTGSLFNL